MSVLWQLPPWCVGSCSLKCDECPAHFCVSSALITHLRTKHQRKINNLPKTNYNVINYMTCVLCGDRVIHDFAKMQRHLRKMHEGLSVKAYYKNFIKKGSKGSKIKNMHAHVTLGGILTPKPKPKPKLKTAKRPCRICSEIISERPAAISHHLRIKHQYSSDEVYNYRFQDEDTEKEVTSNLVNMCTFSCFVCEKETNSWKMMRQHITKSHPEYAKTTLDVERCIKGKPVYYKCHLCQKQILCDTQCIGSHMNSFHGMNLTELKKQFNLESPNKKRSSFSETSTDSSSLLCQNLCSYECNFCDYKIKGRKSAAAHFRTRHPMEYAENRNSFCIARRLYHHCHLCEQRLIWEKRNIIDHFRKVHPDIKLDEYETRFRKEILEQMSLPMQVETVEGKREVNPQKNYIEKWHERFLYQCLHCQLVFNQNQEVLSHIDQVHGGQITGFVSRIKGSQYQCLICKAVMDHSTKDISKHLRRNHEMTLTQYERRFLAEKEISKNSNGSEATEKPVGVIPPSIPNTEPGGQEIFQNGFEFPYSDFDTNLPFDMQSFLANPPSTFVDPLSKTSYKCSYCCFIFEDYDEAENHTNVAHGGAGDSCVVVNMPLAFEQF